jgi:hypothetical protein
MDQLLLFVLEERMAGSYSSPPVYELDVAPDATRVCIGGKRRKTPTKNSRKQHPRRIYSRNSWDAI